MWCACLCQTIYCVKLFAPLALYSFNRTYYVIDHLSGLFLFTQFYVSISFKHAICHRSDSLKHFSPLLSLDPPHHFNIRLLFVVLPLKFTSHSFLHSKLGTIYVSTCHRGLLSSSWCALTHTSKNVSSLILPKNHNISMRLDSDTIFS